MFKYIRYGSLCRTFIYQPLVRFCRSFFKVKQFALSHATRRHTLSKILFYFFFFTIIRCMKRFFFSFFTARASPHVWLGNWDNCCLHYLYLSLVCEKLVTQAVNSCTFSLVFLWNFASRVSCDWETALHVRLSPSSSLIVTVFIEWNSTLWCINFTQVTDETNKCVGRRERRWKWPQRNLPVGGGEGESNYSLFITFCTMNLGGNIY